jgi:hypothetical protein
MKSYLYYWEREDISKVEGAAEDKPEEAVAEEEKK